MIPFDKLYQFCNYRIKIQLIIALLYCTMFVYTQ